VKVLIKHLTVIVASALCGCFLASMGESSLAGVCFGVLGSYALKNGYIVAKKD